LFKSLLLSSGTLRGNPVPRRRYPMSKLRCRLEEELRLRGYSEVTRRIYVRAVRKFVEFHGRSPQRLGAEEIRSYLLHLTTEKQWSRSGVDQAICALKFFYTQVLERPFEVSKVQSEEKEEAPGFSERRRGPAPAELGLESQASGVVDDAVCVGFAVE